MSSYDNLTVQYPLTGSCHLGLDIYVMYVSLAILDTFVVDMVGNKPAALAAGADPSRCKSTNRQNPSLQ